jgi:hypothetical protein
MHNLLLRGPLGSDVETDRFTIPLDILHGPQQTRAFALGATTGLRARILSYLQQTKSGKTARPSVQPPAESKSAAFTAIRRYRHGRSVVAMASLKRGTDIRRQPTAADPEPAPDRLVDQFAELSAPAAVWRDPGLRDARRLWSAQFLV